ncbi:phage major tail tube protein [Klebsiella pneumoniae]
MALPRKFKHLNIFNAGNNWMGIAESVTLPKFTRKLGKLPRRRVCPVQSVLISGWMMARWIRKSPSAALRRFCLNRWAKPRWTACSCALPGLFQRDDTGEVQAVELVVRGRHKEVDSGEWKTGESNSTKVSSVNCYAKLTINGEVLYEVDAINMIEVVDGVDLMEEHRNAIGLFFPGARGRASQPITGKEHE